MRNEHAPVTRASTEVIVVPHVALAQIGAPGAEQHVSQTGAAGKLLLQELIHDAILNSFPV